MVLALLFVCAQSEAATSLFYDGPTLESGSALQAGAVYRFSNVTTGVDALLTISALRNGATISILDDFNNGGYQGNFQPSITGIPSQNASVDFHFQMVLAGTNTGTMANDVNWSILDMDGGGSLAAREASTLNGFSTYTLDNPTHLGATNLGNGYYNFYNADGSNQAGVGLSGAYAVTVTYPTLTTFDVTMSIIGTSNSSNTRLFSEGTQAATFTSPVLAAVPEPGAAVLVGAAGLMFVMRRRRTWQ